ncbi:MAG: DNA-binding response regulator [Candidatus Rokuibacteriota bacterium]|nr:MAG: DNA-binding response regulator [Candidatus Rokubacteria bacterium]
MVREGLRSMLSVPEIEVVGEAGTAEEAMARAAEQSPDVVMLDIQLADADGLAVLRRLKAAMPQTSVLIVTMHANAEFVREAVRGGAAGYVLKGITRRELVAAVRAVREGESVLDPAVLKDALGARDGAGPRATAPADLEPLTRIETEVLRLLTEGLTNRQISERMRWSLGTAKKYVQRVLEKLRVSDRTQAAVEAVRRGLVGS